MSFTFETQLSKIVEQNYLDFTTFYEQKPTKFGKEFAKVVKIASADIIAKLEIIGSYQPAANPLPYFASETIPGIFDFLRFEASLVSLYNRLWRMQNSTFTYYATEESKGLTDIFYQLFVTSKWEYLTHTGTISLILPPKLSIKNAILPQLINLYSTLIQSIPQVKIKAKRFATIIQSAITAFYDAITTIGKVSTAPPAFINFLGAKSTGKLF